MSGNPLYNLHPIFEFTLTACFTMLIAPKFLDDIFGDFIPSRFKAKTENLLKQVNDNLIKAKRRLVRLERLGIGDGIQRQNIIDLKTLISDLEIAISNYKIPEYTDEKKEFIFYINYLYRLILPLGCIYSLIILLVNGCDPVLHQLGKFYYELSIFNFLIFLSFIYLRFRERLSFGFVRVVNIRAMLILLLVVTIFSFILIPQFNIFKSLFEFSNLNDYTVVGTLCIAFCPIVFYILDVYFFQSSMDKIILEKRENQNLLLISSRVSGFIQDIGQQIDGEING